MQPSCKHHPGLPAFLLSAVFLFFSCAAIPVATAEPHRYNIAFGSAMADKFKQLMAGMKAGQCVGPGKSDRVAFTGIRDNNIHLGNSLRETVNRQAFEALNREHGYAYRFNDIQNLGQLASLVSPGAEGQKQLEQAIDRLLKSSPYLVMLDTGRPAKNILQIRITLTARGADKVSRCTKSGELFIRLPDFRTVAPVVDEGDIFVDAGQVYPYILTLFESDIAAFRQVAIVNKFMMEGRCALKQRAKRKFKSSFFAFRKRRADSLFQSARQEWPDLVRAVPQKQLANRNIAVLALRYSLGPVGKDVVNVSVDLLSGGVVKQSTELSMLVNPEIRRGCISPREDYDSGSATRGEGNSERAGNGNSPGNRQEPAGFLQDLFRNADTSGLDFEVRPTREHYRIRTDPVGIDIASNEKLYFYCISIGADRTANIIYPWQKERAWPAGEQRQFPENFSIYSKMYMRVPGKELFGCFASPSPVSQKLEAQWIRLHPYNQPAEKNDSSLPPGQAKKLLETMARQPGIGSSFVWLRGTGR